VAAGQGAGEVEFKGRLFHEGSLFGVAYVSR
jgi:hypothetical protein